MAYHNDGFSSHPEPEDISTISGNLEHLCEENQTRNKVKKVDDDDDDESFWMGWYQQMRSQFGLHDNGLNLSATILFILAPALLLPSLLVPSPPLFVAIPALAWTAGHLSELVGLPPTPMMLVVGVAFRALGWFEPSPVWRRFIYMSRYIAVATVLSKSGLALTRFPNISLAIIPCTAEAVGIAVLSYYFLGFPWLWGLAYGYAVSTASSSVNAEKLAQLKSEGYGPKEIYQLIFPASTVENIYSITGFAVCVAMIFSEGGQSTFQYSLYKYKMRTFNKVLLLRKK
ncbi:unnamed protein product [Nezara viridula]|uniref:Uncharacterized protein n=1 Tax=Nezara viridula TaxID=85310 RepID=A0A9P0E1P2_NEZVI|nr:unnamed protein product [Nezara viridula]